MGIKVTRIGSGDPLASGLSSTGTVVGTDVDWPTAAGDVVAVLDDLLDVNAPAPGDGNVLAWDDGAGEWVPAAVSGSVATDAIWDAKGDLAVGTGADTAARLAVGSNTHVLTADSTTTTGLKWAAATASATITTKDEGTSLSTSVTTLDFVGAGVTASGAGATTTVTIPGGSGGDLTLLEQHTASSSASLDFTTFISSTYDSYLIVGVGLAPATNAASLYLEVGTGGGPTWDTGNTYEWARTAIGTDGSGVNTNGSSGIWPIFESMSNNGGYGFGSFTMTFVEPQSTAHRKTFHGTLQFVNSSPKSVIGAFGAQWTTTGTAATGLRFIMSSGNIASGTIRIYGIGQ